MSGDTQSCHCFRLILAASLSHSICAVELVRVVDDLEWIADQVNHHTGAALGPMREPAIQVLRCCAPVLDAAPRADRDASRSELDIALRAESTGDDAAIDSALPLITVAANVGELELIYPTQADAVTPVVG